MEEETYRHYETRARLIKALAHPTRLYIVDVLSHGEKCVCELTELIGDDISTVSKHLAILKSAGIVSVKKKGLWVFYRLHTPCICNIFSCVQSVLETNSLLRTPTEKE